MYLDQEDAASYKLNEEITLLRWGNVNLTAMEREGGAADGKVLSMKVREGIIIILIVVDTLVMVILYYSC